MRDCGFFNLYNWTDFKSDNAPFILACSSDLLLMVAFINNSPPFLSLTELLMLSWTTCSVCWRSSSSIVIFDLNLEYIHRAVPGEFVMFHSNSPGVKYLFKTAGISVLHTLDWWYVDTAKQTWLNETRTRLLCNVWLWYETKSSKHLCIFPCLHTTRYILDWVKNIFE